MPCRLAALLLLITASMCGVVVSAREGYVRTRDGLIWEGWLRLESNAIIVVNVPHSWQKTMAWADVTEVGMTPWADDGRLFASGAAGPGLPAPWSSVDVGWSSEKGDALASSGGFTARSAGTNIAGRSDSFHFVHKSAFGDRQLIGRVGGFFGRGSMAESQAGLMMRDNLEAGARQVCFLVSGRNGVQFGVREQPGAEFRVVETITLRAPQWLKLTRIDNLFSAFYSRDGRQWKILGRATVVMPEEVAIGVGVAGAALGGHAMSGAQLDFVRDGTSLGNDWFTPQTRMAGGSMQMGDILEMDDAQVRFGAFSAAPVPTRSVINIRFRPVTARVARRLNDGRTGVYLPSGEFVAGEIRGIRSGQVVLSSVPLGLLRFDIGAEVMAIALRKPGPVERRPCRLMAADGSVWHATTMEISGDRVILRDTSFGIRRVPIHEVIELWWGGAAGKS